MRLRKRFRNVLDGDGQDSGGQVLNTGHSEEEFKDDIRHLEEVKIDLETELAQLIHNIESLLEEAAETSGPKKDDLLRRAKRLREQAEAKKERLNDVTTKLAAFEDIVGTHRIEQILTQDSETNVDLTDIDSRDLEGGMSEVSKKRRKMHRKVDDIRRQARLVRESGSSVDLSEEREAAHELSKDFDFGPEQGESGSRYNPEETQDALDQELERLSQEFEDGEPVN